MNTLTIGNDNAILLTGFPALPDNGQILVRVINDRLILSDGLQKTDAAHLTVTVKDKVIKDDEFYRLVHYYSDGEPLSFCKSPTEHSEYIQFSI